jgi:Uma2 family endonuclease
MGDLATRHQWTVVEYAQLADVDAFFDQRCELIEGEILDASPASARHALAIEVLRDFFARSLPMGMCCGSQTPVVLGHDSEPEPDVWVANVARRALGGQSRKPVT